MSKLPPSLHPSIHPSILQSLPSPLPASHNPSHSLPHPHALTRPLAPILRRPTTPRRQHCAAGELDGAVLDFHPYFFEASANEVIYGLVTDQVLLYYTKLNYTKLYYTKLA